MRARGEAIRSRKKMESDFNDLEVNLATATRQAADGQKVSKDLSFSLKDISTKFDDSARITEDIREQAAVSERRVGLMTTEIEELRQGLEMSERCRKQAENDLMEANERANMLHTQNTSFINQKRKIKIIYDIFTHPIVVFTTISCFLLIFNILKKISFKMTLRETKV